MAPNRTPVGFAMVICAVGGMLDAYSYLSADVFAGAQTGNLVITLASLTTADWEGAGRAAIPVVAFAVGAVLGALLELPHLLPDPRRPVQAALTIEIILLVVASILSRSDSPISLTISLALAAGLQMAVFTRVGPWSYSTTVASANIVKWMTNMVGAGAGQGSGSRHGALAYGGILLAFALGTVAAGLLMPHLGAGTMVLAAGVVLVALGWVTVSDSVVVER